MLTLVAALLSLSQVATSTTGKSLAVPTALDCELRLSRRRTESQ